MANVDAPFGARPVKQPGGSFVVNCLNDGKPYPVANAGTYIAINDMVYRNAAGDVIRIDGSTNKFTSEDEDDSYGGLGSVVALYDTNMIPLEADYIATGTTDDGTVVGYADIADHPDTVFESQADGLVSFLADADRGSNCDFIGYAVAETGRSQLELDDSSANTTNTLPVRLLGPAPYETNTVGIARCIWRYKLNNHYGDAHTGV